jgi:hypothetical protein
MQGIKNQVARCKSQDAGFKNQVARCKSQDARDQKSRFKIQVSRCRAQDARDQEHRKDLNSFKFQDALFDHLADRKPGTFDVMANDAF